MREAMRRVVAAGLMWGACVAPSIGHAQATLPPNFVDHLVADRLVMPVAMAFFPDGRLIFAEQITGRLRLIVNGTISATDPAGTVPDLRTDNLRRGIYGIAVDPRWPASPYVYVHYATNANRVAIARFTATGDLAYTGTGAISIASASKYVVMNDPRDAAHNGGTVRFGPDSLLYASFGDSINTPCSAQDTVTLKGVIVRLDVRALPAGGGGPPAKSLITPAGNPLISHPNANARLVWALGLRNPFRFHIDPATGALFIADVGEFDWEEINRVAGGVPNFGWPLFQGPTPFMSCPKNPPGPFTAPIHAYSYQEGQTVIGAGVYRRGAAGGARFPASFDGDYFFSDYYAGFLRRLRWDGAQWTAPPVWPGQPNAADFATGLSEVTDYAQAPDGSLWYLRQAINFADSTGQIRSIAWAPPAAVGEPAAVDRGATLSLEPPRPSPARGEVTIAFRLTERASVSVRVLDPQGRQVRMLVASAPFESGPHLVHWDGKDARGIALDAGIFWVVADAGDERVARTLVRLN